MSSKKAEKKKRKEVQKKNKEIYKLKGLLGFVFVVGTIVIAYNTLINIGIVLLIILAGGLIGFFFDKGKYLSTYKLLGWYGYVRSTLFHVFSVGSLASFLILFLNYYIPSGPTKSKEYKITGKHTTKGEKYHTAERRPVFVIVFEGEKREYTYSHEYLKDMNEYKTISVETQTGLFGFRVVKGETINK